MKKSILVLVSILCLFALPISAQESKPKILYVNSYHTGCEWSDAITNGLLRGLHVTMDADGSLDNSASEVELKIFLMDTKRNKAEEFKKEAGVKAKALIDEWQPDVVIASDDNAAKYLVEPYLKETDQAVVFCGINWDAGSYGFPTDNITGMVELMLVDQTIDTLRQYAKGDRVCFLASDTLSERTNLKRIKEIFQIEFAAEGLAKTFEEFQDIYRKDQTRCDMIVLTEFISVDGFDHDAMQSFVLENSTIPTGSVQEPSSPYVLVTFAHVGEELGTWSAKAALKVISGTSPKDIPLTTNSKGNIFLYMPLAEKLGVKFPFKMAKQSTIIK